MPGSELPTIESPAQVVLGSDVRRAAAVIEDHPWTVQLEAREGSYLRASLFVPRLFGGEEAEEDSPQLTLEVQGPRGPLQTLSVKPPPRSPNAPQGEWLDVILPLDMDRQGEIQVTLSAEDELPGVTAAVLVGDAVLVDPTSTPKTVLLITSDTHRADYVGMYPGGGSASTPILESLARRGTYFEDCQSTTNITTPSHVAIMTGLHPRDTAIVDNSTRLKDEARTLAESFSAAGYRTMAAVSISHLTHSHSGLGQGFDRFYDPAIAEQRAGVPIDKLSEWLGEAEDENVFLWLHVFDAHAPYRPLKVDSQVSESRPAIEITSELLSGRGVPGWLRSVEVTGLDEIRGWYRAEVEDLDRALGKLLTIPRVEAGWIALTSDHGENLGENRRTFEHTGLFQPVLHVPMILAGPGVPVARSRAPVQQLSVGRTLLDLAGLDTAYPGANLMDAALSAGPGEPRFGLSSYGDQASITSGKWHLVLGLRTDTRHPQAPEAIAGRVHLFDRTLGIKSEENFVEEEPEVTRRLHRALTTWLDAQGEIPPLAEAGVMTTRARRRLRALGYSGETTDVEARWWDPSRVETPRFRAYW